MPLAFRLWRRAFLRDAWLSCVAACQLCALIAFANESTETRTANTQLVEWCANSDEISSNYTGFLVTYRVTVEDGTYYALIDLLEFEDGRYEARLIAIENTLSAIKSYIE